MNSLLCIVFTSVLLSQVTCNTLARIKLLKEAGNNQEKSNTQLLLKEIEGRQKREYPRVGRNPVPSEDMSPPYRKHEFAPPIGGQGRNPLPSEDMSSPYEKRELSPPAGGRNLLPLGDTRSPYGKRELSPSIGGRNPLPSKESREHPPICSPVGRRPPIRLPIGRNSLPPEETEIDARKKENVHLRIQPPVGKVH